MNHMITRMRGLLHDDEGQDLLEYALLVALIAIVCYVAVQQSGQAVNAIFDDIKNKLQAAL